MPSEPAPRPGRALRRTPRTQATRERAGRRARGGARSPAPRLPFIGHHVEDVATENARETCPIETEEPRRSRRRGGRGLSGAREREHAATRRCRRRVLPPASSSSRFRPVPQPASRIQESGGGVKSSGAKALVMPRMPRYHQYASSWANMISYSRGFMRVIPIIRSAVTTRQRVLGLGLLWLAGVFLVAQVSRSILPGVTGSRPWSYDMARRVTPLARWDSGWYINIAEAGYGEPPTRVGQETNHAFFPLYPGLMRLVVRTTGLETSLAGNLISGAALLAALLLFADWTRRHFGESRVVPAVLVLLRVPDILLLRGRLHGSASLWRFPWRPWRPSSGEGLFSARSRASRRPDARLGPRARAVPRPRGLTGPAAKSGGSRARALGDATLAAASPLAGFGALLPLFLAPFLVTPPLPKAQHNWSGQAKSILDGPALIWRGVAEDFSARPHLRGRARTLPRRGLSPLLPRACGRPPLTVRGGAEALYVGAHRRHRLRFRHVRKRRAATSCRRSPPSRSSPASRSAATSSCPLLVLSGLAQVAYVWAFVHWYWAG